MPAETESLQVCGDAFPVSDHGFHTTDGVGHLGIQSHGITRQGLDEDLHAHQVQNASVLYVVVQQCLAVLELLAREAETLLIWVYVLHVLDLGLHAADGVRHLDIKGDGVFRQGLDEDPAALLW